MNILVSCANGSGTSLMMMKSVEKSMKKLGIPVSKINHTSIAEGKSTASQYDAVFTPLNFVDMFEDAAKKGVTVVGVKNVMSDKEITQRIVDETDFEEKYKK
ncbi:MULTISPECIES: PTS sugar transporter subunit IIB [Leuconostoc]|jgi:PTS system ascorbate-specific IIB component|uniref:PTS ascorbate transporter subunit IIB n=2 Tax=Leuconostoc TaxID=1243 RepID=A0A1X0VBG1_LEUPS|nr:MULTISPECIES: PTS sugar transporter subunit IIB [Leuconostoc]KDA47153.1 Ascorbate-specific PTS system, EIIB component [Leuconostoc pseudomesenteroides 1159]KDA49360.1 Ascorbate-specific PTS system, EIIB component [Leuconostoc pseudomesenteroides PS12]CCJ66631.1 Ascorbate-specific PTS system, EIIB component [Leuconostoc pseudomesenteroides 4882]MBK0040571.1 PTS sugar transporter subunit IIB [Leuconostoc sp. S51]MBK0051536.1 PTS sugar transporter subunit IIB [Leuconostoc sp. S50]